MYQLFLFQLIPKSILLSFSTDHMTYKFFLNLRKFINSMYFLWGFSESQLKFFSDLLIVDFPIYTLRFLSVYNIISLIYNICFFFKVFLDYNLTITSITNCYTCASWFERECWDLFGVFYYNNLDLRRILNDYGFNGHPLKKDNYSKTNMKFSLYRHNKNTLLFKKNINSIKFYYSEWMIKIKKKINFFLIIIWIKLFFNLTEKLNIFLSTHEFDSNLDWDLINYNLLKKKNKFILSEKIILSFIEFEKEIIDLSSYTLIRENNFFFFYDKNTNYLWYWIYILDHNIYDYKYNSNCNCFYYICYITSENTSAPIQSHNKSFSLFLECNIYKTNSISSQVLVDFENKINSSKLFKSKLYRGIKKINAVVPKKNIFSNNKSSYHSYTFNNTKRYYMKDGVISICRQAFLFDKGKNFKTIKECKKLYQTHEYPYYNEKGFFSNNNSNIGIDISNISDLKPNKNFFYETKHIALNLTSFQKMLKHYFILMFVDDNLLLVPTHSLKTSIGKVDLPSYNLLKNEMSLFIENDLIKNKKFIFYGSMWKHDLMNDVFNEPLSLKISPLQLNIVSVINQLNILLEHDALIGNALKNFINPIELNGILKKNLKYCTFFDIVNSKVNEAGLLEAGVEKKTFHLCGNSVFSIDDYKQNKEFIPDVTKKIILDSDGTFLDDGEDSY